MNMKQLLAFFFYAFLSINSFALGINPNDKEGTCGEKLRWRYSDKTNTLTISGSGEMNNYGQKKAPWFSFKKTIKKIVIEEGATSIGDYAFGTTDANVRILEDTKFDSWPDFGGYVNLTTITIPNSIKSIGRYAFSNCSSLTSIILPNSLVDIGEAAFSYCYQLKSIVLPPNLKQIGREAFFECISLSSIVVPDGVTDLNLVFSHCSALKNVVLPNSVKILNNTFKYCSSLSTIVIPNGVRYLARMSFRDCSSLETITIPSSVEKIHPGAFWDCKALKIVRVYPQTEVDDKAFVNCPNAKIVRINTGEQTKTPDKKPTTVIKPVVNQPNSNKNQSSLLFNESTTCNYDIAELILYPFGLKNCDNKTSKSDFLSIMKKEFPHMKPKKGYGNLSYGFTNKILLSSEGKLVRGALASFSKLNSKNKECLNGFSYLFEFDKLNYTKEDALVFLNTAIKKLNAKQVLLYDEQSKKLCSKANDFVKLCSEHRNPSIYIEFKDDGYGEYEISILVNYGPFTW